MFISQKAWQLIVLLQQWGFVLAVTYLINNMRNCRQTIADEDNVSWPPMRTLEIYSAGTHSLLLLSDPA